MSTDLQTQIRHLAREMETRQEPVTVEEVRRVVEGRDGTEPLVGPASRVRRLDLPRRPWPALIAAVALILLFGALAFLLPSEEAPPPADTPPLPLQGEQTFYTTSAVPDGFVLQDVWAIGDSSAVFLREFEDTWVPTDGGFAIHGISGRPFGLSQDPNGYLDETLETVPGSTEVDVDGRRGVLFEIQFSQEGLTAPLTWVLGLDAQGGVYELTAVGMSRSEVLAVAGGVRGISAEEFLDLGANITWDVQVGAAHRGFTYTPPARVTDLADDVDVAVGVGLLRSRLAGAGGESTVVTTEDGEIVETFGEAIRSTSAALYLEVREGGFDALLSAYPGSARLSPRRAEERFNRYTDQIRGPVLSEDPHVIQAETGPEPRFDPSELGEHLPLSPATSADMVPIHLLTGSFGDGAAATEERPVVVMGTAAQPDSDHPGVTALVWITKAGVTCEGTASDDGMGSGCGFEIMSRYGLGGLSTSESDGQLISGEATYAVPLETSVVQIVTPSQTYWQRPRGGYGVIPFGDTVDPPTSIVAYDADGNELGAWRVGSR